MFYAKEPISIYLFLFLSREFNYYYYTSMCRNRNTNGKYSIKICFYGTHKSSNNLTVTIHIKKKIFITQLFWCYQRERKKSNYFNEITCHQIEFDLRIVLILTGHNVFKRQFFWHMLSDLIWSSYFWIKNGHNVFTKNCIYKYDKKCIAIINTKQYRFI